MLPVFMKPSMSLCSTGCDRHRGRGVTSKEKQLLFRVKTSLSVTYLLELLFLLSFDLTG